METTPFSTLILQRLILVKQKRRITLDFKNLIVEMWATPVREGEEEGRDTQREADSEFYLVVGFHNPLNHTCLVISGPDRQTYEMRQGRAD